MEELLLDEEAAAACWAWEQDYIGMEIAGTIHNEIRLDDPLDPPVDEPAATAKPIRWPSTNPAAAAGRSRSTCGHGSRVSAAGDRIEQRTAGMLRRTRIRRSRDEIAAVGRPIAAEALEMTGAPAIYPSPGPHCLACEFRSPCLSLFEGADPEPAAGAALPSSVGRAEHKPRLGQATWGFGRGAAPPDW